MILRCDSKNKQTDCLSHGGNRNNILNDIVQEADSAKRNVRHGDTHIEFRAYSRHAEKERIKN